MAYFTIPPSHSILDVIADRLIEETSSDPLAITHYHIYLPTRRSKHRLTEIINQKKPNSFLPKIISLTNLDSEAIAFISLNLMKEITQLPKVLSSARRRALLFSLVSKFNEQNNKSYNINQLVSSLETLIDDLLNEHIPLEKLSNLDPGFNTDHHVNSISFLKLFSQIWPAILKEENVISPQEYRRILITLQKKAWAEKPPEHPIWLVGASGSLPEVRTLMKAIGSLATGSVFLPGYDPQIKNNIPVHHPFASQNLFIEESQLDAQTIKAVPTSYVPCDTALYKCLQRDSDSDPEKSDSSLFEKLNILEADRIDEEAAAIALYIRHFLEETHKTILIVTQNRSLAANIKHHLKAFDIYVDDSANISIDQTATGSFIKSSLFTLVSPICSWIDFVALLKHPLCQIQGDRIGYLKALRWFEKHILRGARLPVLWIDVKSFVLNRLEQYTHEEAITCSNFFTHLFALIDNFQSTCRKNSLQNCFQSHGYILSYLIGGDTKNEEQLNVVLDELASALESLPSVGSVPYSQILTSILCTLMSPPAVSSIRPQVQILGILESRLLRSDLAIMAGMNSDTWPVQQQDDPWLNRSMREQIGLPLPEQNLGFAALDMMNILGCKKILLTRSNSHNGKPTQPNIFWHLLKLKAAKQGTKIQSANKYISWVRQRRYPPNQSTHSPPFVHVDPQHLPPKISISDSSLLLNAPYLFYLHKIALLRPLPPLSVKTDAVNFGIMMHDILNKLAASFHLYCSQEKSYQLMHQMLKKYMKGAIAPAFWRRRAENIICYFLDHIKTSKNIEAIVTEISGSLFIEHQGKVLEIIGRTDRIDIYKDSIEIIDYKTGQVPTQTAVANHLAPQLSLEAALYYQGSYQKLKPNVDVQQISYWKLSGKENPVEIIPIKAHAKDLANSVIESLKEKIEKYYMLGQAFSLTADQDNPDYYTLTRYPAWSHTRMP